MTGRQRLSSQTGASPRRTFGVAVEGVADMAGQTHVQRAAEALVVWLRGREGLNTVGVVELPAQRYHAALHPVTRRLAHETVVDACRRQKKSFEVLTEVNWGEAHFILGLVPITRCDAHLCCIHRRRTSL